MAISLADNFSYKGAKPLDARFQYSSVSNMKNTTASDLYDGCFAYVTGTKKYYTYDSTNTVDVVLGKWREYSSGLSVVELTETLFAGDTTVTFTDSSILADSVIDIYTDSDIDYVSIATSVGSVVLTYEAQSSDVIVKVRVS